MIDRIRRDIQERLDQLLPEVDKLRNALAALDPRERSTAQRPPRAETPAPAGNGPRAATKANGGTPTRSPSGATKAKVLAALSASEALTAGEVARATGVGRASVSTTLSKLAKSGEVTKAKRGYRLP